MNATTETDVAKERLVRDFKAVVTDTRSLLKATASQTGEKVAAARVRSRKVWRMPGSDSPGGEDLTAKPRRWPAKR